MYLVHPAVQVAIVIALAGIIVAAFLTHQTSALGAVLSAVVAVAGSLLVRSPLVGASIAKAEDK